MMSYQWIAFIFAAFFIPSVLCCHYGYVYTSPSSTTVSLNDNAIFRCDGDGDYLYWFIDGVNADDITSEDLTKRGISYYTDFNFWHCFPKYSFLSIAGNCLNNNTEVYCVIVGDFYNDTSSVANLTVQGEPVIVNDFKVISTTVNSITVSWDVTPIENSSLTLGITDSYGTVNDTINVTGADSVYNYIEMMSFDPCNVYTFKLTPQPLLAGCHNISTIASLDTYGTGTSDITEINTYNVKDLIITRNGDDVCFTCVTIMDCYMSIEPIQASLHPIKHNASCYSFITNGTYIVYVHDIDHNGTIVLMPTIVEKYIVDWFIPSLEFSSTEILSSSQFEGLMSTYSSYIGINGSTSSIVKLGIGKTETNSQSNTSYILGSMLALSGIILLIVLVIIPIIVLRRKKKANTVPVDASSDSKQCDSDYPVITTTNAAYEMVHMGGGNEGQQASDNNYSLAQSINDAHIYDDPDIPRELLPPAIPPRFNIAKAGNITASYVYDEILRVNIQGFVQFTEGLLGLTTIGLLILIRRPKIDPVT
uniref:Fibronectin type-III domain-containing protein n=1 Tax=Amphimedon queenslandica TaxID=400682 RepID=A0A1X7UFX3_AMPQE